MLQAIRNPSLEAVSGCVGSPWLSERHSQDPELGSLFSISHAATAAQPGNVQTELSAKQHENCKHRATANLASTLKPLPQSFMPPVPRSPSEPKPPRPHCLTSRQALHPKPYSTEEGGRSRRRRRRRRREDDYCSSCGSRSEYGWDLLIPKSVPEYVLGHAARDADRCRRQCGFAAASLKASLRQHISDPYCWKDLQTSEP